MPGETPLLLSNTLRRTLKASINSERQVMSSPLFSHDVRLKLSPRGLYLLDINDLLRAQKGSMEKHSLTVAETFASHDFSERQNASTTTTTTEQPLQQSINQTDSMMQHFAEGQERFPCHVQSPCSEQVFNSTVSEMHTPQEPVMSEDVLSHAEKLDERPFTNVQRSLGPNLRIQR